MNTKKKTKIICTLGPASNTLEKIIALIEAGMDIARMNFSHGTYEDHQERITLVRKASKIVMKEVSILQDLQGPKIRIGELATPSVEIKAGNILKITTIPMKGTSEMVSTTYTKIVEDTNIGDRILIDDGLLEVHVMGKEENTIITEVIAGGILKPKKGLNLPDVNISMPSLTEKDIKDVEFGLQAGVDLIALSFVRSAKDVEELRKLISSYGKDTWIVAKIEKPQAIKDIDNIIDVSNAIMVARGDLGVELQASQVPVLQKEIVRKCNQKNKPVIIATQMLETMTTNIVPTRAEVSDVANAVFDSVDAVMLSAETASGNYPIESVKMMSQVIQSVERSEDYCVSDRFVRRLSSMDDNNISQAISVSSVIVAKNVKAKLLIVLSHSGNTAIRVSKQRANIPVVVITDSLEVHYRMNLVWGVTSIITKTYSKAQDMFEGVEDKLFELGMIAKGDVIVYTLGIPVVHRGNTDTIKISVIK